MSEKLSHVVYINKLDVPILNVQIVRGITSRKEHPEEELMIKREGN